MRRGRVVGFDVARFLAICGLVVVNYKLVMGAGQNGPEWLVRLAELATGRAVATFGTISRL